MRNLVRAFLATNEIQSASVMSGEYVVLPRNKAIPLKKSSGPVNYVVLHTNDHDCRPLDVVAIKEDGSLAKILLRRDDILSADERLFNKVCFRAIKSGLPKLQYGLASIARCCAETGVYIKDAFVLVPRTEVLVVWESPKTKRKHNTIIRPSDLSLIVPSTSKGRTLLHLIKNSI